MPPPRTSKQPKTMRKEVPVKSRAEMYGIGLAGASVSTIHEKFPQRGRSIIGDTLKKATTRDDHKLEVRSGRLKIITAREDRHLILAAIKSGSKGRHSLWGSCKLTLCPMFLESS